MPNFDPVVFFEITGIDLRPVKKTPKKVVGKKAKPVKKVAAAKPPKAKE